MPALDLSQYPWTTWPTAILQVMIDPSLKQPGDLADSMDKGAKVRAAKRLGASNPVVKEHLTQTLIEAHETPKPIEVLQEARYEHQAGETWRGFMSGIILMHALARAATGDQRVSVRSTREEITKACQNRIRGAQESELKTTWALYSSVSHLWATMVLSEQGWLKAGSWSAVIQSRDGLLTWLSWAEALRLSGTACNLFRSRSRSTLLDPDRTWRVDLATPLPNVAVQIPAPDWIITALRNTGRPK